MELDNKNDESDVTGTISELEQDTSNSLIYINLDSNTNKGNQERDFNQVKN